MAAPTNDWCRPAEGEDTPEEAPPEENIAQPNDEIRDMVSRDRFGGILLYGQNCVEAEVA
ncbi:MAG: hypothetical protein IKE76_12395 [Clostridia bacterium]|nr:hypothetical protein [Clostridia bacterium]